MSRTVKTAASETNLMAIKKVTEYLSANPDRAPVVWLMLSSGKFKQEAQEFETDSIPIGYNKVGDLSQDTMKAMCTAFQPALTPIIWTKIQKHIYPKGVDKKIVWKIFAFFTGGSETDSLACHSKKLLQEIYMERFKSNGARALQIAGDFSIDFQANGVYEFCDEMETVGGKAWAAVRHCSGEKAPIPIAIRGNSNPCTCPWVCWFDLACRVLGF
jgi:hypothetical protein